MRIALVSDIHGNLPALEAVVADLQRRGADIVVNLGDCVSGPLMPRETAQYLMAQSWTHLAGNHERQVLDESVARGTSDEFAYSQLSARELDWLAGLRPSSSLAEDIFLCHGTPGSDRAYLLETVEAAGARAARPREIEERLAPVAAALVACGHSHVPRSVRTARGQLIVNPGSVGLPGFVARKPFAHVVQNGSPDARYALVERRAGVWTSSLIAVPYDHEAMARLAGLRHRGEWARALRTGYPVA